jgi:hypothetical protein
VTAFTSAFNRHGDNEATILSLANVFWLCPKVRDFVGVRG